MRCNIIYRNITNEEAIEFAKLCASAYYLTIDNSEKRIKEDNYNIDEIRGVFNEDETMVSGLRLLEFKMYIDSKPVKCDGIGSVASYPEYRKQGNISYLFKNVMNEMYSSDYVLSYLYPFSHPFYRKYGYGCSHDFIFYNIPTEQLLKYDRKNTIHQHIPNSVNDRLDDIISIYDKYAYKYNLMIQRGYSRWKRLYNDDAHKSDIKTYVYYDEKSNPCSYIKYQYNKLSIIDVNINILDIAYTNFESLLNILGFMSRQLPYVKSIKVNIPADMKILDILDEPHDASISYEAGGMARIINAKDALGLINNQNLQTDISIKVNDNIISANNNTFVINSNGSVYISDCKNFDIECSIKALTQLITGYRDIDTLIALNKITVTNNSKALESLFKLRITHIQDKF